MRITKVKQKLLAPQIKVMLMEHFEGAYEKAYSEISFYYWHRIADMVFIQARKTHAIEIKSDGDTLKKLEEQVKDYLDVFDYVSICVGEKHLERAQTLIPMGVGVMVAKGDIIEVLREPAYTDEYNLDALCGFLNASMLNAELKKAGVRGYSKWDVNEKREKLVEVSYREHILDIARERLATREYGEVILEENKLKKVVDNDVQFGYSEPVSRRQIGFTKGLPQ